MMMALFDQEAQDRYWEEEKIAEGIGIGEAKGSFETYALLVVDGAITKEYAAKKLGITVEEFDKRRQNVTTMGTPKPIAH